MDYFELIEARYSVRAYSSRPVEEDKLRRVLRAAQLAPTAANMQPFRLVFTSLGTKPQFQVLCKVLYKVLLAQVATLDQLPPALEAKQVYQAGAA